MSEAFGEIAVSQSTLEEEHRRAGATFAERAGLKIPAHYGDASAEYEAVRGAAGAGVIDLSSRGRIEVGGAEAVQFLNGLITNDVKTLAEGAWMSAAFPNVQGRLLAHARVLHHPSGTFLFDTEAATRERVFQALARFMLAGDFRVADRTEETSMLSLQGARAPEIIGSLLGAQASKVERGRIHSARWQESFVKLIRTTHTAEDGFDIFLDASVAPAFREAALVAGARPIGFEVLELLRVEAGLPRYGVDMTDSNVVLETGLDDAVSFTKGCYVGQEIIARIHWRGHVAKRLAGLSFADSSDDAALPPPESKIRTTDGKEIGRLTSAVRSPRLRRTVALGYVKYDYLKPGTEVRVVSGEEERAAEVAELPFVRGSWFAATTDATETASVSGADDEEKETT